ncbi:TetR/AcrR family transcriptional regulator [Rhodococcus erythropolis]|uniref:TetR/AcrR family transcriptional regulator n=1 Tax=Rhodococcus erythropolis TaxID=1833 RepID=UPI002109B828|nr:TetR/AcrR family transcriptional regulator [Rhodococcus erythropolis]MCQ4127654.1 TetR/AcrR family transcriptional regulator [Rhodococcus erythropolis]
MTQPVTTPSPPKRGRPRDSELANIRREQIVEAAFAVFSTDGIIPSTVADVARRANIGQGTVYRYFAGKRELIDAVFDYAVEQVINQVYPTISGASPTNLAAMLQLVDELSKALFHLVDTRPELLQFVMSQASAVDDELKERVLSLESTLARSATGLIEPGVENGWIRPEVDPDFAGMLMVKALIPGFVHELRQTSDNASRARYRREVTQFLADALSPDTK